MTGSPASEPGAADSPVVADANLLFAVVVPLAYTAAATRAFEDWLLAGRLVVAPRLWLYEAVSALRKTVSHHGWADEDAEAALSSLVGLPVRSIDFGFDLHRSSLEWARRLDSPVAYDAAYAALADDLSAELWTADRRFARAVRDQAHFAVHDLHDREGRP